MVEKICGRAHEEDNCHQNGGGRPSLRAQRAEIAIAEGGVVSLGVEERGEECILAVTR